MKKIWIRLGEDAQQREYLIAEEYGDLPHKLSMAVLRLAYTQEKTILTRAAVLSLVCNMPWEVKALLHEPAYQGELQRLLDQVDWAWETSVEKRPFPAFKHKGATYVLPDEDLHYVKTGEFITAVAYLVAFSQDGSNAQKEMYLNKFLATICRPKPSLAKRLMRDVVRFDGDEREPFSSYLADRRAVQFEKIDLAIKIAILQWFLSAVRKVEALYNMPAPEEENAAPLHLGSFVRDWEVTVHFLAREGNFGNYDAVMERSIHDVLGYLDLKKSEDNNDESDN